MPKYKHLLDDSKVSIIDINVLLHQTPGGMLSNLVNQLREMDALHKIDEVYKELPRVRKELGQIPLVTPTSQIVGIQTVNNVLFDDKEERYKMITGQVKDLCYGLYGKTAIPIDPEVQKKALTGYERGEEPITCRPAEVLEPELEQAQQDTEGLAHDLDDVVLYGIFPVTGKRFLNWKYGKEDPPPEVKSRTLEEIKEEEELVKLAKLGKLVKKWKRKARPRPMPCGRSAFLWTMNTLRLVWKSPGDPPLSAMFSNCLLSRLLQPLRLLPRLQLRPHRHLPNPRCLNRLLRQTLNRQNLLLPRRHRWLLMLKARH